MKNKYLVANINEIPEGGRKIVEVKGMEFGIFKVNGQIYAWRNVCPHAGAPVCIGKICGTRLPSLVYEYKYGRDNEILRCPWHGWEFDLKSGEHLVDSTMKLRQAHLEFFSSEQDNLEPGHLEMTNEDIYLLL
jgi:nitrite reductase/ring-hydroxylating ferredoxin subunit